MDSAISPEGILSVVNNMTDFILRYALALAATSALAMALLEAWKSIFKSRECFHMRRVHQWISTTALPKDLPANITFRSEGFHDQIYRQLILLTTGQKLDDRYTLERIDGRKFVLSPSNALFALDPDRMMGQLQEAADVVLSNPAVYPELYLFLTTGARMEDIKTWYIEASRVPDPKTPDHELMKSRADAFSRLNKFVKRRLDSLQITMSFEWVNWNQSWSIALGGVLLFLSLAYLEITSGKITSGFSPAWIQIFFASLIGGVMAPVAKDLVIALKKVRSGG